MRQVFLRLVKVSRQRLPASERVLPLIFRFLTYSRISPSLTLLCSGITHTDDQIIEKLNQEGVLSAKGTPFNDAKIKWIRFKHGIPNADLKQPDEITVKEATEKFGVSIWVVYYWIKRGIVQARRINRGSRYLIKINADQEKKLSEWVCNSSKIAVKCTQYSKTNL